MKKTFLLLMTVTSLFSCKKEMAGSDLESNLQGQSKTIGAEKTTSEPLQIEVYNECTQETITFMGDARYTIRENYTNGQYSVSYKLNFTGITGIGGISGDVYHGSFISNSDVRNSVSGPNRELSVFTHATFTAQGGNQVTINEVIKLLINGAGELVVYHVEPYTVSCKL